jgi:hypothetical protein
VDSNFEAILYCHPSSKDHVIEFSEYPFIDIVWTEEPWFDSESKVVIDSVTKKFSSAYWRSQEASNIVITTRLDNDDAIHILFNKEVRAKANGITEATIIKFPNGLLLKNDRLYEHHYHNNHFLSLAEPLSDNLKTVFCGNHMRITKRYPNISIEHIPGWLEYIHDRNMKNTLERRRKTDDSDSVTLDTRAKEFGIEL